MTGRRRILHDTRGISQENSLLEHDSSGANVASLKAEGWKGEGGGGHNNTANRILTRSACPPPRLQPNLLHVICAS